MNNKTLREKVLYFVLGLLTGASLIFVVGATNGSNGRYQLSAWSADHVGYGAYLVDTVTGETKVVFRDIGVDQYHVNNLNKPFTAIQ